MIRKANNTGFGSLAAFTVCADAELSTIASAAPAFVSGVEFVGDFHDYITANRRPHFPAAIKRAESCVAFIDFDRNAQQAIETADALSNHASPRIIPVAVSSRVDADLLLRAMRAGCSEFLEKPLAAARLQETLQHIQGRVVSSLAPPPRRGQVVALMGAKGGVGATTLAVHLATYLVKKYGKRTLLVDHHHQLGHVCLYLGMKESNYHFDELVKNVDRLDSALLKGFVVKHSSGLEVLASSDTCAAQYKATREEMEQVLEFLREEYDFVVIDSSMSYEDITESIIQLSDEVALIATADVAALRDLARHVENQRLSEIAAAKLRVIINRGSSNDAISPESIEKAVRFPIHMTIPNNYAELQRAINSGEPISSQRRSEFTTQISKWASRLAMVSEKPEVSATKKALAFWK